MYEHYRALRFERRGPVLWVTIGGSPTDTMTAELHGELAHVFRDISRDAETRAVVLTGASDKAFCMGTDVNRLLDQIGDQAHWIRAMREAREIVLSMLECDKPVVARINGHAVGLGASIALCCDITIMVADAKFGDPHVKMGLVAGDGGALIWPTLVGVMKAKRYLLTGDLMSGSEAASIGLVTEAVPRHELDECVEQWATRMATGASYAIAQTKRSINMAIRRDAQLFMDAQLGLETLTHLSIDHREGAAAFIEKRPPQFEGR